MTIEKLKKELERNEPLSEEITKSVTKIINQSYKTQTKKSSFYKELLKNSKVKEVGFTGLGLNGTTVIDEKKVERKHFSKFILNSNQLPPIKNENALIEVVAPVLTEGKAKWKGIFEEKLISFEMNDDDFKRAVLSKEISFKNGASLICALRINKKIDESGEVAISGYTVETVLDKVDGGVTVETSQGKAYRHTKKLKDNQSDMFNNTDA